MKEANVWNRALCKRPLSYISIGTLLMLGLSWNAHAFVIDTGNPDVSVAWDNTLRYNLGYRTQPQDTHLLNTSYADEGDSLFKRHQIVTDRIDVLSEFDMKFRENSGFRVSAALWADAAYSGTSKGNPLFGSTGSYPNNQFTPLVKRFYAGPSGEFLDAFVFSKFDLAGTPVNLKVGKHTVYWGESLGLGGALNGIAYSQAPLDLQKGFATPGTDAKELFRPLNNISGQAQLSDKLSVEAQYFLDWSASRYPEGGTYLGPADFVFDGPVRQIAGGSTFLTRGNPFEPNKTGEWGIAARYTPDWLDGTLGLYYRRFAEKIPNILRTGPTPSLTYNMVYGSGSDLYGVSLAKQIAGISVGAELSYRHNTVLNAPTLGVSPNGDEARGNTFHGLINGVVILPKSALYDTATASAELTGSRWSKVLSHPELFNALGFAPCVGKEQWDGCATKNYFGLSLAFTPTWFQAYPGVDLSLPITVSDGISGDASTAMGGSERSGNFSFGLGADVAQKYRFDLKYNGYFGRVKTNATALVSQNGLSTLIIDRGYLSLTFKTSF